MPNFSTVLSKSTVGLTASVLLIPVMSSSASAASLISISDVIGIAEKNTSDTYVDCTPFRSGWTVKLSCDQRYTAKAYGIQSSKAGRAWRYIFQNFQFIGNRGRRYRIEYSLTGNISSSVTLALGLGRARAYSGLAPLNGSPVTDLLFSTNYPRSLSDWENHYSYRRFEFNGGSTRTFSIGAQTLGFAEAIVLVAFAEAKSTINFNSIVKITDIGRSRSSPSRTGSVASASIYGLLNASDDDVASVPDENLINLLDEDIASVPNEDLINFLDDDVVNISDENLINLSGDDIVASVPESSTVAGLALVLTMLLAAKRSRYAKKHTEDTEKLVDITAVEVKQLAG